MDQAEVDRLRDQVAELRRGVDDLRGRSQDFPALNRNLARVQASLQMTAIALGQATPDLQGDL